MAMYLQDDQPVEIVFGFREGDHIRIEVLGPTCLEAEEDWYRAQLNAEIHRDGNSYNVWMQLDALERDGEEVLLDGGDENSEWRLAMDCTSLDTLLAAVTRVSERYLTWSVSRS